jgi:hypothetical protein
MHIDHYASRICREERIYQNHGYDWPGDE